MNTILSVFFVLPLLLFTCYAKELKRLPCSTPQDRVAILQIVKSVLEQSEIPSALKKNISEYTIKGYEKSFPRRLVIFRNNSHIVTLNQKLVDDKVSYSLGYAHRGSSKAKAELLRRVIKDYKSKIANSEESDLSLFYSLYRKHAEFTSRYSLHEIPLKYIGMLKASKMWSREEIQATFPEQYKGLATSKAIRGEYFIYVNDNFIVGLNNEYPYFSIHPLKVNEKTILSRRKSRDANPTVKNYLIIPDSMKEALKNEGTLRKAQIIVKELNKRLANVFFVHTVDYKNISEIDDVYGKIYDRAFVVYGEIPSIEKNLSPIERSVMRETGCYFNSILDLQKAGLKVEIRYPRAIVIRNGKGQMLKNSSGDEIFGFTYRPANLNGSIGMGGDKSTVHGQLQWSYYFFRRSVGGEHVAVVNLADKKNKSDDQKVLSSLCTKWNTILYSYIRVACRALDKLQQASDQYTPVMQGQSDRACYDFKKFADEFINIDADYRVIWFDVEEARPKVIDSDFM